MANFLRSEDKPLELQMTPMIDCVFLLLIFFMSTAKMDLENELNLNLPPEIEAAASLNVPIKIDVSPDGDIFLGGEKYDVGTLSKILYVANSKREKRDLPVAIFGDPDARHKSIVMVLDACGLAGVSNVSVATFGEEPPGG